MVTLATADVEIRAKFDKFDRDVRRGTEKSLAKAEKSLDKKSKGFFKDLGEGLTEANSKLRLMPILILNLAKPLAALGGAAIQASAALLTIPGALAALVSVVAVVKIGLIGVGKAFDALTSGNIAEFNKALKGLAPNAKAFLLQLKAMTPQFTAIRKSIQNALFKDFATDLKSIGKTELPVFKTGLTSVAAGVNDLAQEVASFLAKKSTAAEFSKVFADIKTILSSLAPAVQPFLQALTDLVRVGLDVLAEKSGSAAKSISGLSKSLSDAANNGSLKKIIEDGITRLGQLKDIALNVTGIIKGIFTAVTGTDPNSNKDMVQSIKDFTAAVNDFTNSKDGQDQIKSLIDKLATAGEVAVGVKLLTSSISGITSVLGAVKSPGGVATAAFAAIAGSLYLVYKNSRFVRTGVDATVSYFKSKDFASKIETGKKILLGFAFAFQERQKEIDDALFGIVDGVKAVIKTIEYFVLYTKHQLKTLIDDAKAFRIQLLLALGGNPKAFFEAGKTIISAFGTGLGQFSLIGGIVNQIKRLVRGMSGSSTPTPQAQSAPRPPFVGPRAFAVTPQLSNGLRPNISPLAAGTVINQVIQLPTGNPEAAALTVANRIAAAVV